MRSNPSITGFNGFGSYWQKVRKLKKKKKKTRHLKMQANSHCFYITVVDLCDTQVESCLNIWEKRAWKLIQTPFNILLPAYAVNVICHNH